jgi:hypothetical protein
MQRTATRPRSRSACGILLQELASLLPLLGVELFVPVFVEILNNLPLFDDRRTTWWRTEYYEWWPAFICGWRGCLGFSLSPTDF